MRVHNPNRYAPGPRFPSLTLIVEVISGQHIPRPKNEDDGEIIDPYVEVIIFLWNLLYF